MTAKRKPHTLSKNKCHVVDAEIVRQTIQESKIEHSIDMGAFTIHHGTRDGSEIVIAEHYDQQADELSAIWFNDNE